MLIQPLSQISKRLYGESTPWDYLRTAPRIYKHMKNIFQPGRCDTKVRNSDIINALPFDLLLLALQKVPVTSQMVLLFNNVLLYIYKTQFSWRTSVNNPPSFPPSKCIQNESQTLLINFSKQVKATFVIKP